MLSLPLGRSGPPVAIFPQSNTNPEGKASSKRLWAGERAAFQEVKMSEIAPRPPAVRRNLEKNSHYTSFALSKVTDLGLICLLPFYGTEISGSQEVIEVREATTVVVGEAKE